MKNIFIILLKPQCFSARSLWTKKRRKKNSVKPVSEVGKSSGIACSIISWLGVLLIMPHRVDVTTVRLLIDDDIIGELGVLILTC